jgi:hypothetical protein
MTTTPHAITNKIVVDGIRIRMEYARLPRLARLRLWMTGRRPAGWTGSGWAAPPPDVARDAEQQQAVERVLEVGVEADPRLEPCGRCGFTRDEHWRTGINHCPGGEPGDTFAEREKS